MSRNFKKKFCRSLPFLLSPPCCPLCTFDKGLLLCVYTYSVFWTSRKKDPFYGPLPDFHFPHCRPFFVLLGDITRM